ncbi:MAG TPA: hypothetical protein VFN92_05135 [Solirubrobacterales bacterium]|nr:hypothetical protein [Solirubrobacterales bacterium]
MTVAEERGDKALQRAILTFLLAEWPAQHTGFSLIWMGLGDFEELREALRTLYLAELVFITEDERVMPTEAARHFDWLELS